MPPALTIPLGSQKHAHRIGKGVFWGPQEAYEPSRGRCKLAVDREGEQVTYTSRDRNRENGGALNTRAREPRKGWCPTLTGTRHQGRHRGVSTVKGTEGSEQKILAKGFLLLERLFLYGLQSVRLQHHASIRAGVRGKGAKEAGGKEKKGSMKIPHHTAAKGS